VNGWVKPVAGQRARGAAVLVALVVVAIAASLAAAMLARQDAAIGVEAARRQAAQARWILRGALDWARLILREDARTSAVDHLGEPWAVALAPIPLKQFLAVNERSDDAVLEAELAGRIVDAQGKFNLRNLASDGQPREAEIRAYARLLETQGVAEAQALAEDTARQVDAIVRGGALPRDDLRSFLRALPPAQADALAGLLTWLPLRTSVNVNTCSAEVLYAVTPGLSLAEAKSLVDGRANSFFRTPQDFFAKLPGLKLEGYAPLVTQSQFFEIGGAVLWGDLTIEQRALVQRNGIQVRVVWTQYGPELPLSAAR
jgi:general secretion pathway protein K